MAFIPGRLFDFIPSMRRRRLQHLEDIRTGKIVPVGLPEVSTQSVLVLTPQQRVKRAGGALIVASALWLLNRSMSHWQAPLIYLIVVGGLVLSIWFEDRYGERAAAEWRSFQVFWVDAYFTPRVLLLGAGCLLLFLAAVIVAGPERPREKITPLFVTLTGFVFVGPWWRLWRGLRYVFWSLIVLSLALFVVFGVSLIVLESLHWLFGEAFGPPLRWLKYWGGG
jgi:hypothetical protein